MLMNALTTVLGLAQTLYATGVGSEVQRPLAIVVIGGLVSATFFTLFVLPTMYGFFSRRADFAPGFPLSTHIREIKPNQQAAIANGSEPHNHK